MPTIITDVHGHCNAVPVQNYDYHLTASYYGPIISFENEIK